MKAVARLRSVPSWCLLAAAGCSTVVSGSATLTAPGSGRGTSGARSGSAHSAGSSSASSTRESSSSGGAWDGGSTASSSSGSSGGSSASLDTPDAGETDAGSTEALCPAVLVPPTSTSCTSGTSVGSQLVDVLACSAVGGASIGAVDGAGVPIPGAAATSASDGAFALCLPDGAPFSLQMQAASYLPTFGPEMENPEGYQLNQLGLISSEGLQAFEGFIPGGIAPNKAGILLKVAGSGRPCNRLRWGWSFGLLLPDGGAVPDGGYQSLYLGTSDLPDPTAQATATGGSALLYNVDPSISDFFIVTATNPDAGSCVPQNEADGFTGRVFVSAGAVTYDPLILP